MKKIIEFIDKYIIYLLVFLSFLFYCTITENTKIISLVLWPTIALSTIDIIYKIVLNHKHIFKNKIFLVMNIFLMSFLISTLLNYKYGLYKNFRTLFYTIIMFYIIYLQLINKSKDEKKSIINSISIEFFVIATLLAVASLLIIPMKYTVYNVFGTDIGIEGIAWGRLAGFYTDYNYGALIVANAMVLGIYLLNEKKDSKILRKILIGICIILDFIYISFTDSRGTMLAIILLIIVIGILFILKDKKNSNKVFKDIFLIIFSCILIIGGNHVIKNVYSNIFERNTMISNQLNNEIENNGENPNKPEENIESNIESETKNNEKISIEKDVSDDIQENSEENLAIMSKKTSVLNREDGSDKDISNRRFDLWKSSIEIFKKSPIFGVGFENLVDFANKNIPTTYLVNNDYTVFYNFHNVFFNILSGQGIVGIIVFAILIIIILVDLLKKINKVEPNYVVLIGILTNNLVEGCLLIGDIIYFFTPNAIMFWLILGLFINSNNNIEKG